MVLSKANSIGCFDQGGALQVIVPGKSSRPPSLGQQRQRSGSSHIQSPFPILGQ
jgi:hypothetical protein|tara:strand:- start:17559 stop:17720 length:162 start_codon:yes stop_codon:yes gene_type:complete